MKINLSKLRELREKAGMTRKEFAETVGQGCIELTVIRWENGTTKRPLQVYRKSLEKFYRSMEEN